MGFLDLFRRKPADPTDAVRKRFGKQVLARFRAFDRRLATEPLYLAGTPPFEWVVARYAEGPMVQHVSVLWTGTEVVLREGVDGLRVLLAQGRAAGLPFEEMMETVPPLVELTVHARRETVEHLCDASAGWQSPASAAFLERFHPPRTEGTSYVFFAEEPSPDARPFCPASSNIVRVCVDCQTLAVTSEEIGRGVSHKSPFDSNGRLPPGLMMPGRALVTDDGAVVTAPAPFSAGIEAARWREQALGEHASVASFSRAIIELMAVGAPLALLERLHEAALDEIRHTRQCLELARRLDGREVALGAVPALSPRPGGLAEIAQRTLDEAAIPETLAARTLRERAFAAADARERGVLLAQSADEERHAQLAWDIVDWCRIGLAEATK